MICLVHKRVHEGVQVYRDSEKLFFSADLCKTFWKVAEEFPDETLVWVEKDLFLFLSKEILEEKYSHERVMCSYGVRTIFFSDTIGYVDQLPFINIKAGVKYPTWRMSTDVGVIKCKTLLSFRNLYKDIRDFGYLLNSIAKLGQQNGLFCYSDPALIHTVREGKLKAQAGNDQLFAFVYQHYKSIWILVLFFCFIKYEKQAPFGSLFTFLLNKKYFRKEIDLSGLDKKHQNAGKNAPQSIDVIIPTIGRPEHVKQVVEDLSLQSLLPKRVFVVEQQPNSNSKSDLLDLFDKQWDFELVHIFTHDTGACLARNMALEKIESEWVFFADDDIRIEKTVLAETVNEAGRLNADCLCLNCKQAGEGTIFTKIKQWGSFGSGTSMVRSKFAKRIRFSEAYEFGYGEDIDYGMKLRQLGCDIIYHPDLVILHLKIPSGGLRQTFLQPWEGDKPKPSPTMMIYAKRYFTQKQMKGYKINLILRYYFLQEEYNPLKYIRMMKRSWKISEQWSDKLINQSGR